MTLKVLLPVVTFLRASATCYEYQARDPPLYCDNQVSWSVSDTLDPWVQSHNAFQRYHRLKEAYLASEGSSPTVDCLAIAQQFYCAFEFPYCDSEQDSRRGVCSFLCELYQQRCPAEDYDYFCAAKEDVKCSLSRYFALGGLMLLY